MKYHITSGGVILCGANVSLTETVNINGIPSHLFGASVTRDNGDLLPNQDHLCSHCEDESEHETWELNH